jgi:ketosteroid isomerase-like protein
MPPGSFLPARRSRGGVSENLKLVCSILVEWERGDFRSVDWAHPQIEYAIVDDPGSPVGRGVRAMADAWREFLAAWSDYRIEAHEYHELDDERVLVTHRAHGRGKSSGIELGSTFGGRGSANVFHVRDGKVTRLASYFDSQRALADEGVAAAHAHGAPRPARVTPANRLPRPSRPARRRGDRRPAPRRLQGSIG